METLLLMDLDASSNRPGEPKVSPSPYLKERKVSALEKAVQGKFGNDSHLGRIASMLGHVPTGQPETKAPFLTVLTRTQGKRLHTLREVFLCLAAQSCDDFELLVVAHRVSPTAKKEILEVIDENTQDLREKIRFIEVNDGNRTAPLNIGFGAARGDYIAILDDDDAIFAHWIETFKLLATDHPGRVLRASCVRQTVKNTTVFSEVGLRAEGSPEKIYPSGFDIFAHCIENHSPPVSLAFPRAGFQDLGIHFDEKLTTTEDWDILMRMVNVCGIATSPAITSLYRWWVKDESSRTVHGLDEWKLNHHYIWDKLNSDFLVLPPGSSRRIRDMLEEAKYLRVISGEARSHFEAAQSRVAEMEAARSLDRDWHEESVFASFYKKVRQAGLWRTILGLGSKEREDVRKLSQTSLFDAKAYADAFPVVKQEWLDPYLHYYFQNKPAWHSFDPHPLFHVRWYLNRGADSIPPDENPLLHFLKTGAETGLDPNPLFDSKWYLSQNPDVQSAGINPLEHFVRSGVREGRNPHPLFETVWYLDTYVDVRQAGINPLVHFLKYGMPEGRKPNPHFDAEWYLNQYPDVKEAQLNPFMHYVEHGYREGRLPNSNS